MAKIAINGYGRIGRVVHRVILERFKNELDIVAINAGGSTDLAGWMYLLKYDTVYGEFKGHALSVKPPERIQLQFPPRAKLLGALTVDGQDSLIFSDRDPLNLPWKDLSVDVVIESTGAFTKRDDLQKHITAGAKSVILSAPFRDEGSGPTYILGVNLDHQKSPHEPIISNASCTTNCITPVAAIIEESFGIEKAMMTTIHGYTSDQRLQDGGHRDYRRARAAAENIIPTSTGATRAAAAALPSLDGKFNGLAIRVPVPTGSLSDFTFLVKRNATVEEVNASLEKAAGEERFKGIFTVTRDPIVSSDIIGNPYSSIADLTLTQVVGGNMIKVIAWYDNEFGYSNRLAEEAVILGRQVSREAGSSSA